MKRMLCAMVVGLLGLADGAQAADRGVLGWGKLFNNDFLGDGGDRWRSGSYTVSQVRGQTWDGTLPGFGEILEYRLRSEIIAPANLSDLSPEDRRYAGVLSLGLHTHFALGRLETSVGVDLVTTGEQTGVGRFQSWAHGVIGAPKPGGLDEQISNGIHPTFAGEIGESFQFSNNLSVRPFAELRAGDESLLRVGGDLVIGGYDKGALMLRDGVTGQRYRGVRGTGAAGVSFVLGADVARVFDSVYLPASDPLVVSDSRTRVRAGLHWQGERTDLFYGLTWLSKEFEAQPEGQTLGSLSLHLKF